MSAAPYYALLFVALTAFCAATLATDSRHPMPLGQAVGCGFVLIGLIAALFVWAALR
jgi:hypothetical protein